MGVNAYSLFLPPPPAIRRKVFISYFRKDKPEVENFVTRWACQGAFIPKIVGAYESDLINSDDAEYVIGQIRTRYIADSTVTIVLMGSCTHSRRHVDWEIKASLRQGETSLPNGLLGIILPSQGSITHVPPRLAKNLNADQIGCYARYMVAPSSADQLRGWIEDAYAARTSRSSLIINPTESMCYNQCCKACGVTHSLRNRT